jgi:pimeloyl-ACP methyl ester carboxylesterase
MRRVTLAALTLFVLFLAACESTPPVVETIPVTDEHTVEVNGVEIHYFDFNPDADGLPVLYLHGYSGTGYEAFFFQEYLGSRIIAPDLPGLGRSGRPDADLNLSYYLSFVRGFVEALELDHMVLVGHSMGGKFASVYAALNGEAGILRGSADDPSHEHTGMVDALVLLAPYGLDGEAGEILEFLSNTGELVDVGFTLHSQTLVDIAVRFNVFHDPERIPEDLVDYIASATFFTDNGVESLANVTRNAIARDPIDWLLPEIHVPTLVIWGQEDRVLDVKHAETFASLIPDSRLVRIHECGHMPHVERPIVTSRLIREFLDATVSSPGQPQ